MDAPGEKTVRKIGGEGERTVRVKQMARKGSRSARAAEAEPGIAEN